MRSGPSSWPPLVKTNGRCSSPASARPTTCSEWPKPYAAAVSIQLTPSSSAWWIAAIESSSSCGAPAPVVLRRRRSPRRRSRRGVISRPGAAELGRPHAATATEPAKARRSWTNSASSARAGESWNSSKRRQVSRTSSAARSAPSSRSSVPSSRSSSARSTWTSAFSAPAAAATRSRYHEASSSSDASSSSRSAPRPARLTRCSASRAVRSSPSSAASSRSFASAARSRAASTSFSAAAAGVELGRVDRARRLEQRRRALRGRGIEQALGAVEPAARDARDRGRLARSESCGARAEHLLAHRPLGEPPERDRLAARADRLRQRPDLVRDEHDHRVLGRLLEILQQRVGRLVVQQVRAEDEVDAALRLERAHVQVAPHLADGVDPDLVAERLEHVQVGVRAPLDARVAAEQLRRERERRRPLADPGRPVEEVRVRRALGERRRAAGASPRPAQERCRSSSSTSSAISRGGRVPSIVWIRCGKTSASWR